MERGLVWRLAALVAVGLMVYGSRGSFGLFVEPWEDEYGAGRGAVSLISAVGFVAFGLAQPIAGRMLQVRATRSVLAVGTAISAAGFVGGAVAPNLPLAILTLGVIASFGAGLASNVTLAVAVTELFRERQGTLFGVLSAATAGGQAVILPLAAVALEVSLRASILVLGLLLLGAAVGIALLMPGRPAGAGSAGAVRVGLGGIVRERRFWLLLVPFFVCGYTSTGLVDPHLIPYAEGHHIGHGTASAITSTLAAFNMVGVLLAGILSDRLDRGAMLAAIYGFRALTLFALPFLSTPGELFVFAALYGLADFASVPPTMGLCRAIFPPGGWALALGVISSAHQAGSALGAGLGGWLYDATGGYGAFFVSSAVALLVGSALSLALGSSQLPPRRMRRAASPA